MLVDFFPKLDFYSILPLTALVNVGIATPTLQHSSSTKRQTESSKEAELETPPPNGTLEQITASKGGSAPETCRPRRETTPFT